MNGGPLAEIVRERIAERRRPAVSCWRLSCIRNRTGYCRTGANCAERIYQAALQCVERTESGAGRGMS